MSKSRLEKFLYALYSLDSSDLPKPLSRIEELYNCLVTGEEVPTFKPLSRVEKYLMAILGVYELNELPNPISRVEVLLYKLAIGDDNLDDVKSFLSEHEELLAEIIRNGGVGGNIDVEYVLHALSTGYSTLYNTAEKPVKSAILKGNTFINIKGNEVDDFKASLPERCLNDFILNPVKDNTQYLIMYDLTITDTIKIGILKQTYGLEVKWTDNTEYIASSNGKIILNSGTGGKLLRIISSENNTHKIKHLTIIEYQEGMENWDIPYFEGMKSINLYPDQKVSKITWKSAKYYDDNGELITPPLSVVTHRYFDEYVEIHPNHVYKISGNNNYKNLNFYDANKNYLLKVSGKTLWGDGALKDDLYATAPTNAKYIRYNMAVGPNLDEGTTIFDTTLGIPLMKTSITETYFHKMPVLKTVGKNLFNKDTAILGKQFSGDEIVALADGFISDYINAKPNTTYTMSNTKTRRVHMYDENKNLIYAPKDGETFTTPDDDRICYLRVNGIINELSVYQLEEGAAATSFEPHKSNILTVNEPVELRGIGEVKDELDLTTGKLTQRIGEVVLDGNEVWYVENATGGYYTSLNDLDIKLNLNADNVLCDRFKYRSELEQSGIGACALGGPRGNKNGNLLINYDGLTGGVENFKNYLKQNPLTIQVQTEESIKTVDLSVVNQDGDNTKLKTFNDITHVTLSSEGLIPEAELEVATKNEEDLEDSIVYTTHTLSEESNTLYNTAEKLVKSAILKGQTLVNTLLYEHTDLLAGAKRNGNTFTLDKSQQWSRVHFLSSNPLWEVNETYTTILYDVVGGVSNLQMCDQNGENIVKTPFTNNKAVFVIGTGRNSDKRCAYIESAASNESGVISFKAVVLKGDYSNIDIPFFTGMTSVKMPVLTTVGKNLFNGEFEGGAIVSEGFKYETSGTRTTKWIPCKPNTTYVCNSPSRNRWILRNSYGVETVVGGVVGNETPTVTTLSDTTHLRCYYLRADDSMSFDLQIEENSIATEYEPFKTNILTTSEEVESRAIGGVRDELNLITGELTQRIGEVVLDGDENWQTSSTSTTNTVRYYLGGAVSNAKPLEEDGGICDKIPYKRIHGSDEVGVVLTKENGHCYVRSTIRDLSEFKAWLRANPLTVQYRLATESIKTVDLSVADQDGNNAELSTFNDITHVTLSSEGLIPEAELEVAEKVTEVAASMLTISREQEVINATANEQSENTDATMIATTEIYEELL